MIADVDNALRDLLIRELPIRKGEVEITFDLPRREWSSRINKPTLNFFMFDVKQNVELRRSEEFTRKETGDGKVILSRNALRLDLFYLLTAWTRDAQDEHRLLSAALLALLRQPNIPNDLLPEPLRQNNIPAWIKVASPEIAANVSDLWSTLDNEMRAGIRLCVTIAVDPSRPETVAMVRTTELRFLQSPEPSEEKGGKGVLSHDYMIINGRITSTKYSTAVLKLVLAETGEEIALGDDGKFAINGLHKGDYFLNILANERVLKHQKIQVPSESYDIDV